MSRKGRFRGRAVPGQTCSIILWYKL